MSTLDWCTSARNRITLIRCNQNSVMRVTSKWTNSTERDPRQKWNRLHTAFAYGQSILIGNHPHGYSLHGNLARAWVCCQLTRVGQGSTEEERGNHQNVLLSNWIYGPVRLCPKLYVTLLFAILLQIMWWPGNCGRRSNFTVSSVLSYELRDMSTNTDKKERRRNPRREGERSSQEASWVNHYVVAAQPKRSGMTFRHVLELHFGQFTNLNGQRCIQRNARRNVV